MKLSSNYSKYYSPERLFSKIRRYAKKAGCKLVYYLMLLFYVMNDKTTPVKTRLSIATALGYFILPTDLVPDLMPILGFTDDMAVLIFALRQVSAHITPEIKAKAEEQCNRWFPENVNSNFIDADIEAGI
jgi:uncharacterized membrane protein YkvA (DUF1232 family)